MRLFRDDGYLNMKEILQHPAIFIFIYGGRGTGKTYGALDEFRVSGHKFIYMRRLASQVDIVKRDDMQPFKSINRDKGCNIYPFPVNKYISAFYDTEIDENGKRVSTGESLGLLTSLSTFSNLRGFDASDIDYMALDEFIPEQNERPIKGEAEAAFNAYETVNRNRELTGLPPVKYLFLANANRLDNPLFMELNLVTKAEKLRKQGKEYYYDESRRMLLIDLFKSKISEEKSKTALYDLTRGTEFYDMSIKNVFSKEERSRIGHRNIKEYRPIVSIGEITIYRHKSKAEYYVTKFKSGSPETYEAGEKGKMRFKRHHLRIWQAYIDNRVIFEEYVCEILFDNYYN